LRSPLRASNFVGSMFISELRNKVIFVSSKKPLYSVKICDLYKFFFENGNNVAPSPAYST
jgi:hypothetical protein